MAQTTDVIQEIYNVREYLPKKQKALCDYIIANQTQISVMSAAELAVNAGTGPTTVLRLVEKLGFENYNAFKKAVLEAAIVQNTSSYAQMKSSFSEGESAEVSALANMVNKTERAFRNFLIPATDDALKEVVELLLGARHIYITGARSSYSFALWFYDSLKLFMPHAVFLSDRRDYEIDYMAKMSSDDVLFAISAWPCSMMTITAAELASKRNVPIALLTNTKLNPIAKSARVTVDTNSINSPCTSILFMTALATIVQELGRRTTPQSSEALENLEKFLENNNLIVWESQNKT